jgi:hypothetical protein
VDLILAHGSGADEALYVLLPLVLIAVLAFVATRRHEEEDEPAQGQEPPPSGHGRGA